MTHQFLLAPDQRLVASSEASNHRYYAEQLCALPHRVVLRLVPASGPPLEMRVDAPRGAFPPDLIDDYLEVGIDVDRDREFRDEKTYRFQSDRLVVIKATDLHPNGALQLETRVSDFAIDLPADGLSNAVANLLARLSVGPHVTWSESVPVVLDAAPPKIDRVEMNPGRVVEVGSEVEISVWASDADLSGAAKVEIGLGSPSGEFAANPPPVEAELIGGFRWRGQLKLDKLAPGFHTVLIRATDSVGNVGGMHKESLQVVPPGSVPPPPPAATGATITGTVKYGDEPFAGATVELIPLDQAAAKIDPVTPDDGGRFTFKNVPAGEYTLTAQGRARNKLRKAEQAVTVEQGNTGLQLFSLQPR